LRQEPQLQHLKIVAYTAHAMPADVQLLEAAGFDKILIKPIRSHELLSVLAA
jgi:CheY-like chemotaxis protein